MTTPPVTNPDLASAIERLSLLVERQREGEVKGWYLSPYNHPPLKGEPTLYADLHVALSSHEEQKAYADLGRAAESNGLAWYAEDGEMRFQPPADMIAEQAEARGYATAQARIEALEGALRKTSAALLAAVHDGAVRETDAVKFTGNFVGMGRASVKAILDEADALLTPTGEDDRG